MIFKCCDVRCVLGRAGQNQRYSPFPKAANQANVNEIKYYLEGSAKNPEAVSAVLPKVVQELGEVWLEAGRWGLGSP
jgi:hypothetical protein